MNGFYNALYKYISPIFGYIMLLFYGMVDNFNGSYGVAIILYTLFARLILMPTTISQQKSMAKQQRLAPKLRRIQEKFAGNQQKIQEETQNLYAREGFNPMSSGCLPMLIQLPFIAGLFGVLYNPLRYAIGLDAQTSEAFIAIFSNMIKDGVVTVTQNFDRYYPLSIIQHFDKVADYIAANNITTVSAQALEKVRVFTESGRFTFFGLELGVTPSFKHFDKYWAIPIFSGITSLLSSLITQAQQKKSNPGMKTPGMGCTMLMMPAMSIYFAFLFPSGIGVYWIASNVFATVQSAFMKKISSPQKNIAKLMINESIERRSREDSVKRISK